MAFKNLFIYLASAALILGGCSKITMSGVEMSALVPVDEAFTAISVEGPIDVEFSESVYQITVTADANLLPHVEVEVEDGTLKISYDNIRFNSRLEPAKVRIPMQTSINMIKAEEASTVLFYGIETDKLEINLSGASSFTGSVVADGLTLKLSGASSCAIAGTARTCKADLHGASAVDRNSDGYLSVTEKLDITMTGASTMFVYSDGLISGTISGASSLRYAGSATCSVTAISSSVNPVSITE